MKSEIDPPFAIQTPLLAFERICRRTGTIRKTCLFENRTDDRLEVNVRYGFREHSWVHLLAAESAAPAEPEEREQLTLDPGQTRVHVLLNTNSSSFPFDRFRGRIYFQEEENGRAERWVEISFEEIEELRDFEGYAAIDLGTSNSMISLYHLRRDAVTGMPRSPALEGRSPEIPSTVFIRDFHGFQRLAEGSCAVGEAALREYQQDSGNDPRSLQVGTKRLIGVRQVLGADARGAGGYVDPSSLLYMLGRFIRERSQNHGDVASRIRKLAVTFPPTWDYQQVRRWKEVFRHLGFADEELDLSLDEASAAGLFYIYQWTRDADSRRRLIQDLLHSLEEVEGEQGRGERYLLNLLSFDFGGGTIDIAFIEAQLTMLDETIRLRIALKGSDSLGYGGDQVTLAIFRILKRRLAMAISDPGRYRGGEASAGGESSREAAGALATPAGFFLLPSGGSFGRRRVRDLEERAKERIREMWEQLEQGIAAEELSWELEEAVDAVFPTRFFRSPEEPLSPEAKRNFGWLWDEAEGLKRELFRQANRRVKGITLQSDDTEAIRGGICIADIPEEIAGARLRAEELAQARIWVAIGEIYRTIGAPLENAVARARKLAGKDRIDRVVLTGQSSWIPLVRRLFMRPRGEGGFGLPPGKIEFDRENAKAAVSKGACLLRVMRNALVGFDVDVSDFKANLLADIFYKSPMGGRRVLFEAGPIRDFHHVEETPDPAGFARHLALFYGSPNHLLGQFDLSADGEELPSFEELGRGVEDSLELPEGLPAREELLRLRETDLQAYGRISGALLDWPERALISWMERGARPGTPARPTYRYYLTRNRNLWAVRDAGEGGKGLFAIEVDERLELYASARENPYSGVH